ncbi:MAG: InlB B-repeat-containing protein, partial [Anaeroplasma sp.]|nr:InlB B-repeat-containing protein [Anaeroplasma sp.]
MANKKRFLAIVLSLVLVLQMLPTSALGVTFYSARLSGATYYQVDFFASGEKVATQYVESGETLTLPEAPTAAGKSFTGWKDAAGNKVTSDTTVSGDMTVTAVFEDISVYTVTVKYVLADDQTVEVAQMVQRQYFKSYNT